MELRIERVCPILVPLILLICTPCRCFTLRNDNHFVEYFDFENLCPPAYCGVDPDVNRDVKGLVESKGYPFEEHVVQTSDGYLLTVHRIPHGVNTTKFSSAGKRPVAFLQHGLLGASSNWVTNLANESLGFLLADAGYDVWLGNSRGNTYGRRHIKFRTDTDEFWAWSWDEMSAYDLPATLTYVLAKSGQKDLHYVGHSQGTMIAFALFSHNFEIAKKIKLFVALGPVVNPANIYSPVRLLNFVPDEIIYTILGRRDFLPSDFLVKILGETLCRNVITRAVCSNIFFLLCGYDVHNLNQTRLPVYIAHSPAGTSMQNMVHFSQQSRDKKFQKYNYDSPTENMKHYNQSTPPVYNVSMVTTPVALYWGDQDWLATPIDVAALEKKLKNVVGSYELGDWNHIDFIWAQDAYQRLYKDVIRLMNNYR